MLSDGTIVTAAEVPYSGVFVQRYGLDSSAIGSPIPVAASYSDVGNDPTVISLSNDRFLVAWDIADGGRDLMFGRTFTSSGQPLSGDVVLATGVSSQSPGNASVTALPDGGIAIAWSEFDYTHYARVLNADLTARSGIIPVDLHPLGVGATDAVAALSDGGFVDTWVDEPGPHLPYENVLEQVYSAQGQPVGSGGRVGLTTDPQSVTASGNGTFVISWRQVAPAATPNAPTVIETQLFDGSGEPIGSPAVVSGPGQDAWNVSSASLSKGGYVIGWQAFIGLEPVYLAQRFNEDGTALGVPTQLNTSTPEDMPGYGPIVAGIANNGFAAIWVKGTSYINVLRVFQTAGEGP
jgi:hypothetical protein